jgi:hypothetical protein
VTGRAARPLLLFVAGLALGALARGALLAARSADYGRGLVEEAALRAEDDRLTAPLNARLLAESGLAEVLAYLRAGVGPSRHVWPVTIGNNKDQVSVEIEDLGGGKFRLRSTGRHALGRDIEGRDIASAEATFVATARVTSSEAVLLDVKPER